ncbi:MAG: family 10 glycosylhydrolase [Mameliella sp.]|nr:family 10 glycosylhydrolase [Phaeodactylibacter sp.]
MKILSALLTLTALLVFSSCDDETGGPVLSDERTVSSFTFDAFDPSVVATIDDSLGIIRAQLPFGESAENLVPTIEIPEGASIDPASGVPQDFSNFVIYTVTVESGAKKVYTALVDEGLSSNTTLVDFRLPELYVDANVDPANAIIRFEVPFGTDLSAVKIETVTSDPAATSSPASGANADLSTLNELVVTAPDGVTTRAYQIEATVRPQETAVRGVWLTNVDSDVLTSQAKIEAAVQRCKDLNINSIFVVTYNKAATTYSSQVMDDLIGVPIDPLYTGRDPLREVIDAAHVEGIKVFAWFEYGFAAMNGSPGPILDTYPEWAAINVSGEPVVKNGFHWLNPMLPAVRDFMTDLILEVVNEYPDIDGVQGDDRLPAMPSEGGYDDYTVSLYQADHGGADPPANRTNPDWLQWRADILNAWAAELYSDIKAINPNCIVAMSPSPLSFGFREYLQDYTAWLDGGYCDLVSPQLYRRDNQGIGVYRGLLEDQLIRVGADNAPIFYPGTLSYLGSYVPQPQFFVNMINANRAQGVMGEVHFFYNALIANEDVYRVVYPAPAIFPDL